MGKIVSSAPFTRAPERRRKKEANPASLCSAAPSKGRGSRGRSLLPEEGGRMPSHRLPTKKAYDTRMPFSPYCHFERKREIFFVCGQAKDVRIAASWKHRASSESEGRCFMQTALRKKTETGNEKDPSAALGMTKRERHIPHSFSIPLRKPTSAPSGYLLPEEGGRIPLPYSKAFSHIVISNESEKSFSFAVRRGCEECGKRETCFM